VTAGCGEERSAGAVTAPTVSGTGVDRDPLDATKVTFNSELHRRRLQTAGPGPLLQVQARPLARRPSHLGGGQVQDFGERPSAQICSPCDQIQKTVCHGSQNQRR
jgi:hypothetical protein